MIIIEARRWFQRTHGNTYHSVSVWKDGEFLGRVPFTYGYGEQYLRTALEILQIRRLFTDDTRLTFGRRKAYHDMCKDMKENRKDWHISCIDVGRKKDL